MDNQRQQRGNKLNQVQKEYMLDFMIINKNFAAGRLVGAQGKANARNCWKILADGLNLKGPDKSIEQWQKVWSDMKSKARSKVTQIKEVQNRTGNIIGDGDISLSDSDKKVLAIIGPVATEGMVEVHDALPDAVPVKCGYCGWLIGGCENILSHKCLERYDEENDFLNVDDNFVVTLISRQREDTMPAQDTVAEDSTEIDEKLIQAVRDRPALYDFKIPVKERTKLKKDGLWFEISNVLGGVMSSEAAKKRWQYLRDCFNKSKKKLTKYKPSGSAVEVATDRVSFRFYEQMCFLCDSSPSVATVGNVQLRAKSGDGGCSSSAMHTHVDTETSSQIDLTDHESLTSPHPLPKNQTPAAKRQKMLDDKNSELRSALVTALQEPTRPIDSIDGFLARLGEGLRRIPYRQRSQLEIKFLSMLMEVEDDLQL